MKQLLSGIIIIISSVLLFLIFIKITEPKRIYPINAELGLEAVPKEFRGWIFNPFDRYTKVETPNGKAIHILAQSNITNEQMIRSRSILEHYLSNLPYSKFGNAKQEMANRMADNNAILTLLNGEDDGNLLQMIRIMGSGIYGQALFENEIQVEGHSWYINQDYTHRDAAFEEILHLVHDFGIGVDGHNSFPGALPEFQKQIREAQIFAMENEIWAYTERTKDWIEELSLENSLSQEYLASLIDTYYGLWGAWQEKDGGMWGIYKAKTRKELKEKDPKGYALMQNLFFHPYLNYEARIDPNFQGTFQMKYDAEIPYTNHSQYLKDICLLGINNINIQINTWDNNITGNKGINTALFSGQYADYTITYADSTIKIKDKIAERDGTNVLQDIEKIQFIDTMLILLNKNKF